MYYWNPKTGRYHERRNNVFVKRSQILKYVDCENERTKVRMQGLARRLTSRNITLREFQALAIEELKKSHIRMTLLGSGGKASTSKAAYGATGNRLKEEYVYLTNFVSAISRGELTENRIIWRSGLYGNSAAAAFYKSEQISKIENKGNKMLLVARSLDPGASQHCQDCPSLSTYGKYLSVEQVTLPTRNCVCRSRCRCQVKYKLVGSNGSLPNGSFVLTKNRSSNPLRHARVGAIAHQR